MQRTSEGRMPSFVGRSRGLWDNVLGLFSIIKGHRAKKSYTHPQNLNEGEE